MAEIYVSTDIESDGPVPGLHSMLSFGSAAYTASKELISTFQTNLELLPDAASWPETMEWWKGYPEAWNACRSNPQLPVEAMKQYLEWIKALPGNPVFVAYPLSFDYGFIHWYLMKFTGENPFQLGGIDIKSYAMALLKVDYSSINKNNLPKEWLPLPSRPHKALEDAIIQGELFCNMLIANTKVQEGVRNESIHR